MDDSKLLQELNLTAVTMRTRGTHHVHRTIMSKQLVQGRYAAAWIRFKPNTLWLQGTKHTTMTLQSTASEGLAKGP